MTIKIGSNLASLNAQRKLGEAEASLSKVFERLSSGQRINRASDDAAGLAIADDLKAKNRIYAQALRNGNDGISLLNIADSAIEALSGVVTRIRELSEQAANGTYSDRQRAALDAEAQALSKEFTRITQTTSFNGIKLFDGSLGSGVSLQMGIGLTESLNASIGGTLGTGNFGSAVQYSTESFRSLASALGDLNGDGILDLVTSGQSSDGKVTIRLGTGDGSFSAGAQYSSEINFSYAVTLGDLNGDGILDLITAGYGTSYGSSTVRLGLGNGTFGNAAKYTTEAYRSHSLTLGDLNNDGVVDLVTAGIDGADNGWTTVRLGNGNGSFGNATRFSAESNGTFAVKLGDLNHDGFLDMVTAGEDDAGGGYASVRLGLGNGSFGTVTVFSTDLIRSNSLSLEDINADGILDLATAGQGGSSGTVSIRLGIGNGTFAEVNYWTTEGSTSNAMSIADLDGNGIMDIITAGNTGLDGYASIRIGEGSGNFGSLILLSTESRISFTLSVGDLNGDGALDLVTGGMQDSFNGFANVRLAQTREGLGAMLKFSLKTKADALQSIGILDRTMENLGKQRGTIGASQSRVSIALNNLQSARENFSAAESRIRDADVAAESAALIRTQILQQAAAAVLSQANQQPSLALQLLS